MGILECAYNYCISTNQVTSDQACEIMAESTNRIGRNKLTHACIDQSIFVPQIDICVSNYCIAVVGATVSCELMTAPSRSGKEAVTHKCLAASEKVADILECVLGYYY